MSRKSLTTHARQRMQQRGISELQIELLRHFGVTEYQKGGAHVAFIPRKTLTALRNAIDKLEDVVAIHGDQDRMMTAFHQTRNIHRTRYAA